MNKQEIRKLKINLCFFGVMVSATAFTTTVYKLSTSETEEVFEENKIVFEPIEEVEVDNNFNSTQRQEMLEIRENKELEYSGMNLSHEYEYQIKELCAKRAEEYNLDEEELFEKTLVIGDQESNGTWETNGIISATNDYGEFQINECNLKVIEEELGYTKEELLNDQYKNADAAIWLIANIMTNKECVIEEDIYGMYNGWTTWKEKKESIKYVESCLARAEDYFCEVNYLTKK